MYTFAPNKSFGQLLDISPKRFIFLKSFNSEISSNEVWFTDQNFKPLDIGDKTNITLVINQSVKYKKIMRYSVQPSDRIFVQGYGFLSFAKNKGKNIGKNVSKNLTGKYGPGMLVMRQELLDHAKQSTTDAIKTSSKRVIWKIAEATGDLTGNKIADKITKLLNNSQQNNSETVKNEHDKEIPKERYLCPEERQEIIDELRLK